MLSLRKEKLLYRKKLRFSETKYLPKLLLENTSRWYLSLQLRKEIQEQVNKRNCHHQ